MEEVLWLGPPLLKQRAGRAGTGGSIDLFLLGFPCPPWSWAALSYPPGNWPTGCLAREPAAGAGGGEGTHASGVGGRPPGLRGARALGLIESPGFAAP